MYWYISFLRPPPVSAEAGSSITITPQVANDLRTEIRYEPTEIYYFWRCDNNFTNAPPQHLTTFTPPESTYRAITIPLPAEARIGDKWRLSLYTPDPYLPEHHVPVEGWQDILVLSGPSKHCLPLTVESEDIEIVRPNPAPGVGATRGIGAGLKAKGKGKEKVDQREKGKKGKERDEGVKQSRIKRDWGTPMGGFLKIIEQTSFDLDKKIWDSGLALSSWFYRHISHSNYGWTAPLGDDFEQSYRATRSPRGKACMDDVISLIATTRFLNIVELGSGTGLVSIALCSILGQLRSGRIAATDLESAIDLMRENFPLNPRIRPIHNPESGKLNLEAKVLDWDQPLPSWVALDDEAGESKWPTLIIAADVTYNTASFPSLIRTLKALLLPSDREERPKLLLAYKQRDPGEKELWAMLEKEGIGMVLVDKIAGAEEEGAVEIWVGGADVVA